MSVPQSTNKLSKTHWLVAAILCSFLLISSNNHADTFADNFDTTSYANQDGSHNWAGNWVEFGDNGSPFGGDVNITGGELHLQDDNNSISRQVDLSAYISATLSFDYREVSLDNANEEIDLEIRTGGGAWILLQRFEGPTNDSGSVSIDISAYLASDTEIRFITSGAGSFTNFDDFYVDNLVIDATASISATYLDLFSSVSYGNNDGALSFATNWIETGDDGNPGSGDIDIVGGELHLQDDGVSISRQVDLSTAVTAILSFNYREDSLDNANEYVDLQIRTGGGAWVQIQRFAGPANDTGTFIFNLAGYLAVDTEIRFVTSSTTSMNNNDDFYVDNFAINATFTLPAAIGHWQLEETTWDGSADQVLDISGNDLHGYTDPRSGAHPSPEITSPAIAGSDGTCGYGVFEGANQGFIQVDDPGTNSLLDISTQLTLTAWIHPRSLPPGGGDFMAIASKDSNYEVLLTSTGQILMFWNDGANNALTTSGAPLTANEVDGGGNPVWHHVAITYISGEQHVYIDGVERATDNQIGTLTNSNLPFTIGTDWYFGGVLDDRTFDGFIDEVMIFDQALTQAEVQYVMNLTHPCSLTTVDHYRISYDGGTTVNDSTGITCEPSSVTIVAHGAGHLEPVAPVIGTSIQLSTSTGDGHWSNPTVGSVVDNGNGNATYTWAGNDSVTLQFNHTVPAINPNPVNIDINSAGVDPAEDVAEDPNIQFFDTGFRFVDGADNPVIGDQVAAQTSGSFFLQAVRTDTQTGSCVGVFPNGASVNLELAAECNNPLTCAGQSLSFTNNGNTSVLSTNDDNAATATTSYTTVNNVLFGTDSKAEFVFNYPDVGALSLHGRFEIINDDGTVSGDFMLGSSNSFVVSPANFVVTAVDDGAVVNPGTTGGGLGFVAAGDPFRVTVEARNALGNITPNYGNEISPESVVLSLSSLVYPAGGSLGTLGNAGNFSTTATAGEFLNSTLIWNEVGTFTAFASVGDGDYLGAGNVNGSVSGNIGRFYPADFELLASTVTNSCVAGNFSYMSDPSINVNYQIAARNRGGATVVNYDNTDLTYATATVSAHAEDNNDGIDRASRVNLATSTWDDGLLVLTDTAASVSRLVDGSLNVVPDGIFSDFIFGLQISDADSANFSNLDMKADDNNDCIVDGDCSAKALAGSLDLRFGRMVASDAHGPESAPIPMQWQMEYWNGSGFVINTDDHCTQLPLSALTFVGAATAVDAANDTITVDLGGVSSAFDFGDPVGASDCMSPTAIGFCDGRAGIEYGAPGSVVTYEIDFDLSVLDFLKNDWNQDGSYDDSTHPRVTIRFQHYRGHDRIIYWRERLQ